MSKHLVIMAGGTGGHIFPALAVAENLLEKGWTVSWIGTRKGLESRVIPENNIEIDYLSVNGLRGKGKLALLKMPWMLLKACWQARGLLKSRQPNVVLGMGGFVAGPTGLMAKYLGIPLIIHEQNRVVGTTNRLLAHLATEVLEAFPHSFSADKNAVWTGNPLRKGFINLDGLTKQVDSKKIRILVLGGSLGAQRLNEVLPETLALFDNIEVQHQSGTKMREQVQQHYQKQGVSAQVVDFIEDMVAAYRWADVVICRAGAMTVSEVAAAGVPSILVPYPYAIDDHQTKNAEYLVSADAGVMIQQTELTVEYLEKQIKSVIANLESMAKSAIDCAKLDATECVATKCIERSL